MESFNKFLRRFFLNYCWLGIIIILTTIIVDIKISDKSVFLKVIIEFFKTVGISIIVASIFTWASDSYAFVEKIQQLLRSVVVNRDFLSNLDPDSKMDALKSLIKPSSFEKNVYTNIDDYYDFYIKNTLEISNKNVRSDYSVNARIYFDYSKNLIACERTGNYRMYPTIKGYEDIRIGFTDIKAKGEILYVRIFKSDGGFEEIIGDSIETKEINWGGTKAHVGSINMNKYSSQIKHLIVEFKTIEYGFDHWIAASIQTLQPTDGIVYRVWCEDGIKIVDSDTFGQGVDFQIDKANSESEISVATYQWLNEGAGINIIASKS